MRTFPIGTPFRQSHTSHSDRPGTWIVLTTDSNFEVMCGTSGYGELFVEIFHPDGRVAARGCDWVDGREQVIEWWAKRRHRFHSDVHAAIMCGFLEEHEWGEVGSGFFTGEPRRECLHCPVVTLDLHDDEITDWTVDYTARNANNVAWSGQVTVYACEDTVEEAAREEIRGGGGPAIVDLILVDFRRHEPNEHVKV